MTQSKPFADEPAVGAAEFLWRSRKLIQLDPFGSPAPAGGGSPAERFERAPDRSAPATDRVAYLEAIRGLASFQVLLLHTLAAFAPALVWSRAPGGLAGLIHFSPLFLAYDGYSAVYVFFVLSGFVLTPLFDRFSAKPFALTGSRWVRLGAPALVSAFIALAIKLAVGAAPAEAGRIAGSGWLSGTWRPPAGLGYFLYDALIQGPPTGYSQTSLLADRGLPIAFNPVQSAYVSPFWTLSIEMQGSLLLLALIMTARRRPKLSWPVFFVCFAVLLRTDFVCFLIGHLLARANAQASLRRMPAAAPLGLATLGMSLCIVEEFGFVAQLTSCRAQGIAWLPCSAHSLKMIGAILIFVAALGSLRLAKILKWPPFVALGRLSFSLYLVHWPIVVGVCSVIYLTVGKGEDSVLARATAILAALSLSLVSAGLFSSVDAWSISASRRLRGAAGVPGRSQ